MFIMNVNAMLIIGKKRLKRDGGLLFAVVPNLTDSCVTAITLARITLD